MKIPPTLQGRGSHQDVTIRMLLEAKVECAPILLRVVATLIASRLSVESQCSWAGVPWE